jgi:uncharacterized repeat protein (TIGR01451 family)
VTLASARPSTGAVTALPHHSYHSNRENNVVSKLSRRAPVLVLAAALPLLAGGAFTPASAATGTTGAFAEAYGLSVDTTLLAGNVPVAVGPLAPTASSCPPTSKPKTAEVLNVPADPVVDADVIDSGSATDCTAQKSLASAQTTNVNALGGVAAPLAIHADVLTSTASVSCAAAPTGKTVVTNLTVGGTAVPLPTDVPPNTDLLPQVFAPFGLRVILNEQHPAASGRGIVVNALHVIAAATGATIPVGGNVLRGDVVVSHAFAGVVCPGGPGSVTAGLPKPDITFDKSASPTTAQRGDTVTYTATVTNTSTTPCEVLRFIDHLAPAFDLVSTAGPFGTAYDKPAPVRTDGGVDAVLRPAALTIAAGKSVVQTFKVTVKDAAAAGTYYNSLELYCGPNGDFASGPLAPVTVTVPAAPVAAPVSAPVAAPATPQLPRTGLPAGLALGGLALMGGLAVLRRRTA